MSEPALAIAALLQDSSLEEACRLWLRDAHVSLERLEPGPTGLADLLQRRDDFDALLLQQGVLDQASLRDLKASGPWLPAVVIGQMSGQVDYHDAELHLPVDQLEQLRYSLDAAIANVLRQQLGGGAGIPPMAGDASQGTEQWKLTSRLQERLGYLGVFYKRDPARFLRNLPEGERQVLLRSLERTYRDVLLSYFRDPAAANQAVESFVNTAFFADLSTSKTVEIHVSLIDSFAKQLKLEGHKSDFLQDYRLALIDVMAHLCEMYRRSVPADAPLGRVAGSLPPPPAASSAAPVVQA